MDPASITPDVVRRHAFILCLDVPVGTQLGIDMKYWTTGDKFKGLKLIPPGPHIVYWSAIAKDSKETASRSCMWLYLRSEQVAVLKWSQKWEGFMADKEWPEDERARYADGVLRMEFDSSLGVYPQDMHPQWQNLTTHVTEALLKKLNPVDLYGTPFYSTLPSKRQVPQGLQGAALTQYGLDKSQSLEELLQQRFAGDSSMLLGELQYSFVTFLIGEDFGGFDQWKNLVALLCNCEKAILTRPALFVGFAEIICAQLHAVPEDFFIDPLSEHNFLTAALKAFFELVQDPHVTVELMRVSKQLKQLAEQRFAVSFDVSQLVDPSDEDAPVVVEDT